MSKPEDKPSFFDPSDQEASSWPPADSYEPDDETENQETVTEPELVANASDDFLVPVTKEETGKLSPEPEVEPESTAVDEAAIIEEATEPITEEVSNKSDNFNVDDLFDSIDDSRVEPDAQVRNQDSSTIYPSNSFGSQPYLASEDEELKPFRTYAAADYSDVEVPAEESTESTISNLLTKVNRNVLILAVIVIAVGIYFLVTTISSRNYDSVQGRTRAPRREKRLAQELRTGQRIPVWEISSQKTITELRDAQITKAIFESSGRDNPFAIPDSILADYRKAAEIAAVKQQGPNTYKRIAYRALLVGVLTSKDSTVALIDVQEAAFDVVEGTGKTKILQLAVKAMDKAKKNTQEMVVGSYVGPWGVTKIEAAKNAYSEAKVTIEYGAQRKTLSMGKAEELGIFDEQGNIDNLENPVENVNLDDFAW